MANKKAKKTGRHSLKSPPELRAWHLLLEWVPCTDYGRPTLLGKYILFAGTENAFEILEALLSGRIHSYQESWTRPSVICTWPHAPHVNQLCTLSTAPSSPLVEEKTCTESAPTRPPFLSLSKSWMQAIFQSELDRHRF